MRRKNALILLGAALAALTVPAAPASAQGDGSGSWSTASCGTLEQSPVIPAGSLVRVVVTGAPGTWAWGINGGTGHAGGRGSMLVLRSAEPSDNPVRYSARAGCTSEGANNHDIAGGAGWAPGGAAQKGGGAGGGASGFCVQNDDCTQATTGWIVVGGGGGGGGGGTCSSQWGWAGGDAGTGPLTSLTRYTGISALNGGDGSASGGSGAVVPPDAPLEAGSRGAGGDYLGGQLGGASGGGGGIFGGKAGRTYGGGCQTGGGGGGGASAITQVTPFGVVKSWILTDVSLSDAGGSVSVSWQPAA